MADLPKKSVFAPAIRSWKVDGKQIAGIGISTPDVYKYLKGPKGSEVALEIVRNGTAGPLNFKITRDKIPQYSLDASYMVDSEIGYVKIRLFNATTYEEFKAALVKLKGMGMKKLVLDLQGNPGRLSQPGNRIVGRVFEERREDRLHQRQRQTLRPGSDDNRERRLRRRRPDRSCE
ncbi:MAG: S41 family peptidase [Bacteroidota bacterium]